MALSEAAKEKTYLKRFIAELGFPSDDPLPLHCDMNTAARDVAYNPEHHGPCERTKHIQRRHFFVRYLVDEGTIVVLVATRR